MPDDDWTQSNARRLALCDKLFDTGGLTNAETVELDLLQLEAGRRANLPWGTVEIIEASARREASLPPVD